MRSCWSPGCVTPGAWRGGRKTTSRGRGAERRWPRGLLCRARHAESGRRFRRGRGAVPGRLPASRALLPSPAVAPGGPSLGLGGTSRPGRANAAAAPGQRCRPRGAAFQGQSTRLGPAFRRPAGEKVQGAQGSSRRHLRLCLHLRAQRSRPRAGRGHRSHSAAGLSQPEGGSGAAARPSLQDPTPQDGAAAPPSLTDTSRQIPLNAEPSACLPGRTVRSERRKLYPLSRRPQGLSSPVSPPGELRLGEVGHLPRVVAPGRSPRPTPELRLVPLGSAAWQRPAGV